MLIENEGTAGPCRYKQRFNSVGKIGAALFVGAPTLAAVLFSTSLPAFLENVASRYAYRPEDELYSLWLYLILLVLTLAGVVMMMVGRDLVGYPSRAGEAEQGSSAARQHSPGNGKAAMRGIWRKIADS